jgi:DNA-binding protein Alba
MQGENVDIGSKPILNHVTALMKGLQEAESVNVMARGRATSSAVVVVEVTWRGFLNGLLVDDISIGTERLGEAEALRNVSTISIRLKKSA